MCWVGQGKIGVITGVKEIEFDSIYFGVNEDEEHMAMIFLDPDTCDLDLGVDENQVENNERLYTISGNKLDEYTPKQVFSEVVKEHSDISEDFPQEYGINNLSKGTQQNKMERL